MKAVVSIITVIVFSIALDASDMNIYPDVTHYFLTANNRLDSICWKDRTGKVLQKCSYSYSMDTIFQSWYDSINTLKGVQINIMNSIHLPMKSYGFDGSFTQYYYGAIDLDSICMFETPQSTTCFSKIVINRNISQSIDTVTFIIQGSTIRYVNKLNTKGDVFCREEFYETSRLYTNSIYYDYENGLVYDTCKDFNNKPTNLTVYTFKNKRLLSKIMSSLTSQKLPGGIGYADVFYYYNEKSSIALRSKSTINHSTFINEGIFLANGSRMSKQNSIQKRSTQFVILNGMSYNTQKTFWLGSNSEHFLP